MLRSSRGDHQILCRLSDTCDMYSRDMESHQRIWVKRPSVMAKFSLATILHEYFNIDCKIVCHTAYHANSQLLMISIFTQ